MRSDTTAIIDRLHAALRETDGYLTTRQVGDKAGTGWVRVPHNDVQHNTPGFSHCLGGIDYFRTSLGLMPRTWTLLMQMEKKGLVFRAEVEGHRSIYWAYVENVALDLVPLEDLEQAWSMEAHDHE